MAAGHEGLAEVSLSSFQPIPESLNAVFPPIPAVPLIRSCNSNSAQSQYPSGPTDSFSAFRTPLYSSALLRSTPQLQHGGVPPVLGAEPAVDPVQQRVHQLPAVLPLVPRAAVRQAALPPAHGVRSYMFATPATITLHTYTTSHTKSLSPPPLAAAPWRRRSGWT
ncbi:hypothetical protein ON010_g4261 [Phytophthora cinnamomi]|nr:hypothetical protein ON010_g4261 [Phytophthora cinnamomi]